MSILLYLCFVARSFIDSVGHVSRSNFTNRAQWKAFAEMVPLLGVAFVVFFLSRLFNPEFRKIELHFIESLWAFCYLAGMGLFFYFILVMKGNNATHVGVKLKIINIFTRGNLIFIDIQNINITHR